MKTKLLFGALAILALLGLPACSSDAPDSPGGENQTQVGDKYIAVSICNTSSLTRGAEEDHTAEGTTSGFEEGTTDENAITEKNVRFYFFDKNGLPFTLSAYHVNGTVTSTNMVEMVSTIPNGPQDGKDNILTGVLVLGTPTGGYVGTTPSQVICVANPGSAFDFDELANRTIEDLEKELSSEKTNNDWKNFTMTNSVYAEGTPLKETIGADCSGKFKSSASEAESDPLNIYVERTMAKVRVKGIGEPKIVYNRHKVVTGEGDDQTTEEIIDTEKFKIYKADNSFDDVQVYVDLTGWRLMNQFTKVKLLKDIEPFLTNAPFENWNSATYHRSYWANTRTPAGNVWNNNNLKIEDATTFPHGNFTEKGSEECYTYPSCNFTAPKSISDREGENTAVAVRGIICSDKAGTQPLDIVYWNGQYWYTDEFKKVVANKYNQGKEESSKIDGDQVVIVHKKADGAKANTCTVTINGTPYTTFNNFLHWDKGQTSYWVNIQHATKTDGKPLYGVVRNHIYETDITQVIGMGVPGNELTNREPETETYLAARINVLNWRLVSNTVTLE